MAEIHSLIDPNKITVCFFYCLPHSPELSAAFSFSPWLQHRVATTARAAAGGHKL